MLLIHENHIRVIVSPYEKLEDSIRAVFYLEQDKYWDRFFLIYQSSFKRNGYYYMCLTSIDCEDEYAIVSSKFISLKEINRLVKKTANMFFREGGAVTEYDYKQLERKLYR